MGFDKLLAPLTIHRNREHRIVLHGLPQFGAVEPALLVKYAGEGNDGYERERRAAVEQVSTHPDGPNKAALLRKLLAPVFAAHVVTGWEGLVEDDGSAPAFTAEKCGEFLAALASHPDRADVFGLLYQACNAGNFRDPLPTAVSVGKG